MRKIKCLVVDDERLAQEVLVHHISKFEILELEGICNNVFELISFLNKNKEIDLIFLDIKMPEINGTDFVSIFNNPPAIIYTTAYDQYALDAFNQNAIDYLLKPISFDKFAKAIEKAKIYSSGNSLKKEDTSCEKVLLIRVNGQMMNIPLADIIYIESLGNYMKLYSAKLNLPLIVYGALSSIASEIDSNNFVQVHRSFIVNVDKITAVTFKSLTMCNAEIIPVGRKYQILLDSFFR